MGVGTILDARKVVLMAFGEHKARIVRKAVEEPTSDAVTASFLQQHPDATFLLDRAAAGDLSAVARPWTVGPADWTPALVRKAVIWLSLKVDKALLKLSDDDFREHELYELLREHGPAHRLGRRVFDEMMATICTQPGIPNRRQGDKRAEETRRQEGRGDESSPCLPLYCLLVWFSALTPTTTSSAWAARSFAWWNRGTRSTSPT